MEMGVLFGKDLCGKCLGKCFKERSRTPKASRKKKECQKDQ